jgi:hypothetical protein
MSSILSDQKKPKNLENLEDPAIKTFWHEIRKAIAYLIFLGGIGLLCAGALLIPTPLGVPLITTGVALFILCIGGPFLKESIQKIFATVSKLFKKSPKPAQIIPLTKAAVEISPSFSQAKAKSQEKSEGLLKNKTPGKSKDTHSDGKTSTQESTQKLASPLLGSPLLEERRPSLFERKIDDSKDFRTLVQEAQAKEREKAKSQKSGKLAQLFCVFSSSGKVPGKAQRKGKESFSNP